MTRLLTLCLFLWIYELAQCCTYVRFEPQPIENRATQAETIVYAEAVQIFRWNTLDPSLNIFTAEFNMLCPLKNKEKFVSELETFPVERPKNREEYQLLFNVTELGSGPGPCVDTKVELKQRYFLFIRNLNEEEKEISQYPHAFKVDAINSESPVLEDNADHRNSLRNFITPDCSLPTLWSDKKNSVDITTKPSVTFQHEEKEEENAQHIEDEKPFVEAVESFTEIPKKSFTEYLVQKTYAESTEDGKTRSTTVGHTSTFMAERDMKLFPNLPGVLQRQAKLNSTEIPMTPTSAAAIPRSNFLSLFYTIFFMVLFTFVAL